MRESIRPIAGATTLLALMGVRYLCPHNMIDLCGPVVDQDPKLRSVPLRHQFLPAFIIALEATIGKCLLCGIPLLSGEQGPCDPRGFVGKRYDCFIESPASDKLFQPLRSVIVVTRKSAYNCACTMDHLATEVMVRSAANSAKPWFAARRVLSRDQPDPSR